MKSPIPPYLPAAARIRVLQAAVTLLEAADADVEHVRQVTRLSLRLFDQLRALHGMGERERFWLECAALLHDIGRRQSQRAHHKVSQRIIMRNPLLPLDQATRRVIGCVARYHRKARPRRAHSHFRALDPATRRTVRRLAAMLRVADALDLRHAALVEDISCEVRRKAIVGLGAVRASEGMTDELAVLRRRARQRGREMAADFSRRFQLKLKAA